MMTNKAFYALALAAVSTFPVAAQEVLSGVSRPDEAMISATSEPVGAPAKPSAAVPVATTHRSAGNEVYGAYVPYAGPKSAGGAAGAMTEAQADATVVTSVEERAGELREGTLLRARLAGELSTAKSEPGSRFSALLTEPVEKNGRVVMPVGSTIKGRITSVHSGRRISGAALIHLEAESLVLPDGTRYLVHLQLIDTDQTTRTKIDREGSLVRRDYPKETLAAVGLATGGAATAGALIGGGVGAAVGAGIGAGAGTVVWLKESRQEVVPEQTLLVFSLAQALPLTPQGGSAISESRRPMINPDAHVVGEP